MANGICVYAESYNGELETVAAELVSAAKGLAETTKEKVQAIVLSDHAEELVKELDKLGVDEVYGVKADNDITLQDDAVSAAIAEMLKKIEPSAVLVPATPQGRSIFSRVAMRLGCGMTVQRFWLLREKTVLSILNRTNRPTEKMYLLQFLQKKVFIRR